MFLIYSARKAVVPDLDDDELTMIPRFVFARLFQSLRILTIVQSYSKQSQEA